MTLPPVRRPPGGGYTFECRAFRLLLDDGVDYVWCPKCGGAAGWVDRAPRAATTALDLEATAERVLAVFFIVQAVLAVVSPDDFPYLKTWLVIAQLGPSRS